MSEILYTLTPDAITTQGEGIARFNGKAVFIPFVLPGETCRAAVIETRKNYSRALPVDITHTAGESSSWQKAEPLCPVFGLCGGCQLQHLHYAEQTRLKRLWLAETFRRIAHIEIDPPPIEPAPPWDYRNKITLPIVEHDGQLHLAYHRIYQAEGFVPIDDCPIAHPRLRRTLLPLRRVLREAKPTCQSHQGKNARGSQVVLRVMGEAVRASIEQTLFDFSVLETFDRQMVAPGYIDELLLYVRGGNHSVERMQVIREGFEPQGHQEAFAQVNDALSEALYRYVLSLPFTHDDIVLDGYCGSGWLTARLADRFNRVIGVETHPLACQDAQSQLERQNLQNQVTIKQGQVEAFLYQSKAMLKTLIFNPPRAGLSLEARHAALRHDPDDIVIISCHPAALARDVSHFIQNQYVIDSLHAFDMFPQTYHYEAVAHLKKNNLA